MLKAALLYIIFAGTLAYYHRPEFVFVAAAGFAIFMYLGVLRVEAMPKITEADVAKWMSALRKKRKEFRARSLVAQDRKKWAKKVADEEAVAQKEAHAHHGPQ